MQNHKNIYLIPGLGADERLFQKWEIANSSLHSIRYILPKKRESLQSYAKRLLPQIKHENPVLVGHSLGGVLSQEIAEYIPTEKIFIIGSMKTAYEKPPLIKRNQRFPIYKFLHSSGLKYVIPALEKQGLSRFESERLYWTMLRESNTEFLKWGFAKVVHWKRKEAHPNLIHIQGDNDEIFPKEYLQEPFIVVEDLRHFPYKRSPEICRIIEKELGMPKASEESVI